MLFTEYMLDDAKIHHEAMIADADTFRGIKHQRMLNRIARWRAERARAAAGARRIRKMRHRNHHHHKNIPA